MNIHRTKNMTNKLMAGLITGLMAVSAYAGSWAYSSSTDAMDNSKSFIARTESREIITPGFPYKPHHPQLVIRNNSNAKNGLDIFITFSGQAAGHYDTAYVEIKADDGPIKRYTFSDPSDGSTGIIFINRAQDLLKVVKTAKSLKIKLNYFTHGYEVMTFDVNYLDLAAIGKK